MLETIEGVASFEGLAEALRESTRRLADWMAALFPEGSPLSAQPASPQQMSGLLAELMKTGQRLRQEAHLEDPALAVEVAAYRWQVERLRDRLPAIQRALVEERSRLEQERARLRSASEWARRSRETL